MWLGQFSHLRKAPRRKRLTSCRVSQSGDGMPTFLFAKVGLQTSVSKHVFRGERLSPDLLLRAIF